MTAMCWALQQKDEDDVALLPDRMLGRSQGEMGRQHSV